MSERRPMSAREAFDESRPLPENVVRTLAWLDEKDNRLERYERALEAIRTYDAFQGGPIAPRENPTTAAMRRIAAEALG